MHTLQFFFNVLIALQNFSFSFVLYIKENEKNEEYSLRFLFRVIATNNSAKRRCVLHARKPIRAAFTPFCKREY